MEQRKLLEWKMFTFNALSYYLDADTLMRAVHGGERLKEVQHVWIRVLSTADQHPDLHLPLESSCPDGFINYWPVSVW